METRILNVGEITPSVISVTLEKPVNFEYKPGQFINITLTVENCDERCNKRNFTLTSSPLDDNLMIATRRGISRFKKTLTKSAPDTIVNISPPLGRFTLNEENSVPLIMFAGGIGITPFHSMIRYAAKKNLLESITLLYSNTKANDVPFKEEFDAIVATHPRIKVHHTITGDESWEGRRGRIDEDMIRDIVKNLNECEYYVCGPQVLVTALVDVLKKMNIREEKIKFEQFTGY